MTGPLDAPYRRPRRRGLWALLTLAVVIVAGWSVFWWIAQGRLEQALADFRGTPAARNLTWREARVGGYPFRLRVELLEARATLPDGVGVAAPRLVAQAYIYRPDRWLADAPEGLTLLRPVSGNVAVRGREIRASVVDAFGQPRLAVEGLDLTLAPVAGAEPFLFDRVARFELEAVRGPPSVDQAAVLWTLEGARGRPGGLMTFVATGGDTSARFDLMIERVSRFAGADAGSSARAWAQGGGVVTVRSARIQAGPAAAEAQGGSLRVDADGRLRGALPITLTRGAGALAGLGTLGAVDDTAAAGAAAMTAAQSLSGQPTRLDLRFQNGRTFVGPFALGPAPRLF